MIPPGSVIGILGGGQLGRMTALAAYNLGYKIHIYSDIVDAPALDITPRYTVAPYNDRRALQNFAESVDIVTFEFENIPARTVEIVAEFAKVAPSVNALSVSQNRLLEKKLFTELGIKTASFAPVTSNESLFDAYNKIGGLAILKTVSDGYDGKGQARINSNEDLRIAWQKLGNRECILEGVVDFIREVSVIIARNAQGQTMPFPATENVHMEGILRTSRVVPKADVLKAYEYTAKIAESLDLVGLLAVEFFVNANGDILANEMAPRPHNSGHWTMDGCATSQFEQLIRAICGLPFGSVECRPTVMHNLIGDEINNWPELLKNPASKLHIYGKSAPRPGRKMGHYNTMA